MSDDDMWIDIRDEPFELAIARSSVCARCGAFVIHLDRTNLAALHDQWHQRNDHDVTSDDAVS